MGAGSMFFGADVRFYVGESRHVLVAVLRLLVDATTGLLFTDDEFGIWSGLFFSAFISVRTPFFDAE